MELLPRSWRDALGQLARDVRMVTSRARGRRSSPFSSRAADAAVRLRTDDRVAREATLLASRTVRVVEVVRETADAVTLVFEDQDGAPLPFSPGQFFTLLLPIGESILRRAYSACSDARDPSRVAVTVKRVAGGVASNHLNDRVREGDLLKVLGPSGSFGVKPARGAARRVVLIAGGSGITPMMAIARTTLAVETGTRITVVYGNRGEGDIIFRDALAELARVHAPRLVVRHVLSVPPSGWAGGIGLLDERVLSAELDACGDLGDADFLVCGPEPMMDAARACLGKRGVPPERIAEERFNMPHLRARASESAAAGPQLLTLRTAGSAPREIYVAPGQTVLEAGLSAGVSMDYSCAMGGCGACMVRLLDGEVEMEEPNCLTTKERMGGYVLACVARLQSAATVSTAGDPAFSPGEAAQ